MTTSSQIIAPQPSKIAVNPGWTLVSIPGVPQDSAINNVLDESGVTEVWSLDNISKGWDFARYDDVAGIWEGTLQDMVDGRAYFVRSTTFQPISVLLRRFSPQNAPSMYTVTSGWEQHWVHPRRQREVPLRWTATWARWASAVGA